MYLLKPDNIEILNNSDGSYRIRFIQENKLYALEDFIRYCQLYYQINLPSRMLDSFARYVERVLKISRQPNYRTVEEQDRERYPDMHQAERYAFYLSRQEISNAGIQVKPRDIRHALLGMFASHMKPERIKVIFFTSMVMSHRLTRQRKKVERDLYEMSNVTTDLPLYAQGPINKNDSAYYFEILIELILDDTINLEFNFNLLGEMTLSVDRNVFTRMDERYREKRVSVLGEVSKDRESVLTAMKLTHHENVSYHLRRMHLETVTLPKILSDKAANLIKYKSSIQDSEWCGLPRTPFQLTQDSEITKGESYAMRLYTLQPSRSSVASFKEMNYILRFGTAPRGAQEHIELNLVAIGFCASGINKWNAVRTSGDPHALFRYSGVMPLHKIDEYHSRLPFLQSGFFSTGQAHLPVHYFQRDVKVFSVIKAGYFNHIGIFSKYPKEYEVIHINPKLETIGFKIQNKNLLIAQRIVYSPEDEYKHSDVMEAAMIESALVLQRPYADMAEDPNDKADIRNWDRSRVLVDIFQKTTTVHRYNHGLAHSLRTKSMVPYVVLYLSMYASDVCLRREAKALLRDHQKMELLLIVTLFMRAGRESEASYSTYPDLYFQDKETSKTMLMAFFRRHTDLTKTRIEFYGNIIKNMGDPQYVRDLDATTDAEEKLLQYVSVLTHVLDLPRCNPVSSTPYWDYLLGNNLDLLVITLTQYLEGTELPKAFKRQLGSNITALNEALTYDVGTTQGLIRKQLILMRIQLAIGPLENLRKAKKICQYLLTLHNNLAFIEVVEDQRVTIESIPQKNFYRRMRALAVKLIIATGDRVVDSPGYGYANLVDLYQYFMMPDGSGVNSAMFNNYRPEFANCSNNPYYCQTAIVRELHQDLIDDIFNFSKFFDYQHNEFLARYHGYFFPLISRMDRHRSGTGMHGYRYFKEGAVAIKIALNKNSTLIQCGIDFAFFLPLLQLLMGYKNIVKHINKITHLCQSFCLDEQLEVLRVLDYFHLFLKMKQHIEMSVEFLKVIHFFEMSQDTMLELILQYESEEALFEALMLISIMNKGLIIFEICRNAPLNNLGDRLRSLWPTEILSNDNYKKNIRLMFENWEHCGKTFDICEARKKLMKIFNVDESMMAPLPTVEADELCNMLSETRQFNFVAKNHTYSRVFDQLGSQQGPVFCSELGEECYFTMVPIINQTMIANEYLALKLYAQYRLPVAHVDIFRFFPPQGPLIGLFVQKIRESRPLQNFDMTEMANIMQSSQSDCFIHLLLGNNDIFGSHFERFDVLDQGMVPTCISAKNALLINRQGEVHDHLFRPIDLNIVVNPHSSAKSIFKETNNLTFILNNLKRLLFLSTEQLMSRVQENSIFTNLELTNLLIRRLAARRQEIVTASVKRICEYLKIEAGLWNIDPSDGKVNNLIQYAESDRRQSGETPIIRSVRRLPGSTLFLPVSDAGAGTNQSGIDVENAFSAGL